LLRARCDELIAADEKWELDHRDDGNGWLGPSHRSCNRSAGWENMVGANGNGREFLETPTGGRGADPPSRP
jgi:hypothetical protein